MKTLLSTLAAAIALALILFVLFVFGPFSGRHGDQIGAVSTNFRLLGPNDKVLVQRFDDPKVANVSCYASFAQTGGVAGGVGVAEDPSQFALNCVAHGPVSLPADLPEQEEMGAISASLLFKHFIITRMVDRQTNTLVYVLISTRVLHGSPANAVSAVPAGN
ncbi:CreA family protein [Acidocella sp. KAb 2-4]|uniref:CreA family protein n=1 Tax=Acidocella sp. KAb 2-4 TaxID=2885158 RepID=UPI001D07C4E4|nr:CreA family protein [Acidocella sp. KAb 2-4]MCB5944905.1 CreA family protein [Acidocella sp. KAb 2-4]